MTQIQVPDDDQIHAYVCPQNQDILKYLDIQNSDSDLVLFFKQILDRRVESGEYWTKTAIQSLRRSVRSETNYKEPEDQITNLWDDLQR